MRGLHLFERNGLAIVAGVSILVGCSESREQSAAPLPAQNGVHSNLLRDDKKPAGGMEWNFTIRVVSPFETAQIVAYCTGNHVVTGGGWKLDSANSGHLNALQSHPGNRFDSWSVTVTNDSATKAIVRVYAGCLSTT